MQELMYPSHHSRAIHSRFSEWLSITQPIHSIVLLNLASLFTVSIVEFESSINKGRRFIERLCIKEVCFWVRLHYFNYIFTREYLLFSSNFSGSIKWNMQRIWRIMSGPATGVSAHFLNAPNLASLIMSLLHSPRFSVYKTLLTMLAVCKWGSFPTSDCGVPPFGHIPPSPE